MAQSAYLRVNRRCFFFKSGGVALWFLLVDPAGRGLPSVPSWSGLGDFPAWRLFDPVAGAAARARVAGAGSSALVIWDGVLLMQISSLRALCGGGGNAAWAGVRPGSGGARAAVVRIITAIRGTRGRCRSACSGGGTGRGGGACWLRVPSARGGREGRFRLSARSRARARGRSS